MNYTITSTEPLIFRDGLPFGNQGQVNGGSLPWPWPSTISGVIRCRIGEQRAADFFTGPNREANIEAIKELPCLTLLQWRSWNETAWQPLFPAPADSLCEETTDQRKKLSVHPFSYQATNGNGGTDLPWPHWLLPESPVQGKPAQMTPPLWFKDPFFNWLRKGKLEKTTCLPTELGLSWPCLEFRMHTAISAQTGTADHGRLFSSQGIRLESGGGDTDEPRGQFAIGVRLPATQPGDKKTTGPCHFGGERRVAFIEETEGFLPPCPAWFAEKKYLRLILASPGKFGGWCPDRLLPHANGEFTTLPGSTIKLRLVSAHVARWSAISGWDFAKQAPKAFEKLVPAGSVYIVELADKNESQALANHLWGNSLNQNPDGFGLTLIGNFSLKS